MVLWVPTENVLVVGNGCVRAKGALCVFVQLVGIGHFGKVAYHNLSRQVKTLLERVVQSLIQIILAKGFLFPFIVADDIARCIGSREAFA